MKLSEWFDKWSMTSLKVNTAILNMEFKPNDHDKNAAWEMYVELLTRITTQSLSKDSGDEKSALESIYSLYPTTREILKQYGRHGNEFSKIAIIILNQKIRPFTAKWHKILLDEKLNKNEYSDSFRKELIQLQSILIIYAKMLADIAELKI